MVDAKPLNKNILKYPDLENWLPALADEFTRLADFSLTETERVTRQFADSVQVKPGVIINGVRTVVTGQLAGPSLFDILITIGRDKVIQRLRNTPRLYQ